MNDQLTLQTRCELCHRFAYGCGYEGLAFDGRFICCYCYAAPEPEIENE